MKRIRLPSCIVVIGLLCAAFAANSTAQPGRQPIRRANVQAQLKLTPEQVQRLRTTKPQANMKLIQQQYLVLQDKPMIRPIINGRVSTRQYQLIELPEFNKPLPVAQRPKAQQLPQAVRRFEKYFIGPQLTLRPSSIDRRSQMTPIRDQGNRGTCVAHASLAALEAFDNVPDNLSEQYAFHLFMDEEGKTCQDNVGLRTTNSAGYLAAGVCVESRWPYQDDINDLPASHSAPFTATANAVHKITDFQIVEDNGLSGNSIKNTAYLETLLWRGYNIVYGVHVAWQSANDDGILDVVLDENGDPLDSRGGHAMVLCGYNRNQQYFIVKNSWDDNWEHDGYGYLSYDYVETYSKYGYYILGVQSPPRLRVVPGVIKKDNVLDPKKPVEVKPIPRPKPEPRPPRLNPTPKRGNN